MATTTPPVLAGFDSAFALVDVNNFYVSCERLFRPDLAGRPVVVLSNNDGCVISRSQEAKRLGIVMGAPWFKHARQAARDNVAVFSSNYAFYGDMSRRVMEILEDLVPRHEVYSVDECFLDLTGIKPHEARRLASEAHRRVERWTGLPVSIGLGPTRVLAKLANRHAKPVPVAGSPAVGPVVSFDPAFVGADLFWQALDATSIAAVWGVGRRLSVRMQALGWTSAGHLARAPAAVLRARFGVVVERLGLELRGIPCLERTDVNALNDRATRQQILSSRSFGGVVSTWPELSAALLTRTARAGEKLRQDGLVARAMLVFAETGRHDADAPYRRWQKTETLPVAVSDPLSLAAAATRGARAVFAPGRRYRKGGVMLLGLEPARCVGGPPGQGVLFGRDDAPFDAATYARRESLGQLVDELNTRFGRGTVAAGVAPGRAPVTAPPGGPAWHLRCQHRSAVATTDWQELPYVH